MSRREQAPWSAVLAAAVGCALFGRIADAEEKKKEGNAMALSMTSPAFKHEGEIPEKYTCEGEDRSPELVFSDVPANAKTLALIVDDPDAPDPKAPKLTWVHWVLFNIPASTKGFKEGASKSLPAAVQEGLNDWKRVGWGGPCPPIGRHRYFFKLYALDTTLSLNKPSKAVLEKEMEGHVIAKAELIGTYQKKK
jgi:Raf kinase inhibitor-like YbhB/YbcL family protein